MLKMSSLNITKIQENNLRIKELLKPRNQTNSESLKAPEEIQVNLTVSEVPPAKTTTKPETKKLYNKPSKETYNNQPHPIQNDQNITYICDYAYIINLERSKDRFNKISKLLNNEQIEYQRFPAIDGYNMKIRNLNNHKEFSGKDFKSQKIRKTDQVKYQITCDPWSETPTKFLYQGYSLNVGELGIYCSNLMIWKVAVKNQCNHSLIFEDDIVPIKSNFKQNLDKLITDLPATYDITWLGTHGAKHDNLPYTKEDSYVRKSGKWWDGLYAYMVSLKAATKLLTTDVFSFPIDVFLSKTVVPDLYEKKSNYKGNDGNLIGRTYELEGYIATESFVDLDKTTSTIHGMGASYNH